MKNKDGGINLLMEFNVSDTEFPFLLYAVKVILVIFGTVTAVSAFTEPTYLPFGVVNILAVSVPVLIVGFLLKLIPVKLKWIRIIAGLFLMFVYIYAQDISLVVTGIEDIASRIINGNYSIYVHSDWVEGYIEYDGAIAALNVLTILVTVILYVSTVNRPNMGLQILATLPLYSASYIIGMKPGAVALQLLGFYLGCYVLGKTDLSARYDNRRNIEIYERKSTENVTSQAVTIVWAIFIVVTIVYMIVYPSGRFNKKDVWGGVYQEAVELVEKTWEFVKESIENLDEEAQDIKVPEKNAVTGFSTGELGEFDNVEISNELQLVLRDLDKKMQGSIYLRGYVASNYYSGEDTARGRSYWENGTLLSVKTLVTAYDNDVFEDLVRVPYEALAMAAEEDTGIVVGPMYIEKINREEDTYFEPSFYYSPMNMDHNLSLDESDGDNWQVNLDLKVAHIKYGDYTMAQLSQIGEAYLKSEKGSKYADMMADYYKAVSKVYVRDRHDVLDRAYMETMPNWKEDGEGENDDEGEYRDALINEIMNYVYQDCKPDLDTALAFVMYMLSECEYTLSPGATENGTDFVEDFLFEKKEGYCTHFASAAAVMLQELGIPARYVTGYMVDTGELIGTADGSLDGEGTYSISVRQSAAHAWVEVYVENFGWVVFEPTAAAALGDRDDIADIIIDDIDIDIDIPDIDVDSSPQDDNSSNRDNSNQQNDASEKEKFHIEITAEIKFGLTFVSIGVILLIAVWILCKRQQYKYRKFTEVLESDDLETRFAGFAKLTEDMIGISDAPVHFYETRKENAKALYDRVFDIINSQEIKKKNPQMTEPDLTIEEYLYVFEALDKGDFDKELPRAEDIDMAISFVNYTMEILYKEKGMLGQFILKYIKCLYLK